MGHLQRLTQLERRHSIIGMVQEYRIQLLLKATQWASSSASFRGKDSLRKLKTM